MSDTTALLAHIQGLNAATLAWVAENPTQRWACTYTEDMSHWLDMKVSTVEEFTRYNLVCEVFEATRSVWGYKPSWSGLMSQSVESLQSELETLMEASKGMAEAEAMHDAYNEELEKQEQFICPLGELMFIDGCWKVA